MSDVSNLHHEAMDLADQAFLARRRGESTAARELLESAFHKEQEAARVVAGDPEMEPTRSVLLRSAASLALQCEDYREAEKLVMLALTGSPPTELEHELRELLEEIAFQRDLAARGIHLAPNELQLSMTGRAVGPGVVESRCLVGRVADTEKLIFRTRERLRKEPFSPTLPSPKSRHESFPLYVRAKAGSFTVDFRIGGREQLSKPGAHQLRMPDLDFSGEIIGEFMKCFSLFTELRLDELRDRIADESYTNSFFGLAKRIAPDGQDIRLVSFGAVCRGERQRVVLNTPRSKLPSRLSRRTEKGEVTVSIHGMLRFADALAEQRGEIRLVDSGGQSHRIEVPAGMMDDIVKPLWSSEVVVTGTRKKNGIVELETIDEAATEER